MSEPATTAPVRAVVSARFGRIQFGGCSKHPGETTLSCAKIRREDGSAMTDRDVWVLVQDLYAAIPHVND